MRADYHSGRGENTEAWAAGADVSRSLSVVQLATLILLIVRLSTFRMTAEEMISATEVLSPGISNCLRRMVRLRAAFVGWEDALVPSGKVREPRPTLSFASPPGPLGGACNLHDVQFIVVVTPGAADTDAPLATSASLLLGRGGVAWVSISALSSTAGWISGAIRYAPRLAYSLAALGESPSVG